MADSNTLALQQRLASIMPGATPPAVKLKKTTTKKSKKGAGKAKRKPIVKKGKGKRVGRSKVKRGQVLVQQFSALDVIALLSAVAKQ